MEGLLRCTTHSSLTRSESTVALIPSALRDTAGTEGKGDGSYTDAAAAKSSQRARLYLLKLWRG